MRIPPWTIELLVAGLVAGALVTVESRTRPEPFLATRVPGPRLDSVLTAADSVRLRLGDARALLEVLHDSGYVAKLPHDTMTVADLLAWAREERVRKAQAHAAMTAAERARQEEARRQLEPLLGVSVVKKTYLPKDPASEQFEDYISLAFAYQNNGTKAIQAFQGDATFLDAFGDSIYSAHLKVALPLTPGQTRREPARIVRFNPFRLAHQRLRDTPLDKMKLVWQTTDVLFADGSRISIAAEP
jgi:hypothetical protein